MKSELHTNLVTVPLAHPRCETVVPCSTMDCMIRKMTKKDTGGREVGQRLEANLHVSQVCFEREWGQGCYQTLYNHCLVNRFKVSATDNVELYFLFKLNL